MAKARTTPRAGRIRQAIAWLLAVLSILILIAWLASARFEVIYFWSSKLRFAIAEGRCRVSLVSKSAPPTSLKTWWSTPSTPVHSCMWFKSSSPTFRWDFGLDQLALPAPWGGTPSTIDTAYAPGWTLSAGLAIASWSLFRLAHVHPLARFRRAEGHCAHCNYDLRGITGVCPECGR